MRAQSVANRFGKPSWRLSPNTVVQRSSQPVIDGARRLARLAVPLGVVTAKRARAFGRSHGLSTTGVALFQAYRDAERFGLHLLPPGLRLDGLAVKDLA